MILAKWLQVKRNALLHALILLLCIFYLFLKLLITRHHRTLEPFGKLFARTERLFQVLLRTILALEFASFFFMLLEERANLRLLLGPEMLSFVDWDVHLRLKFLQLLLDLVLGLLFLCFLVGSSLLHLVDPVPLGLLFLLLTLDLFLVSLCSSFGPLILQLLMSTFRVNLF